MKYVSVRLRTIRPQEELNFDIYLYIDNRYLHYINKNDLFDRERFFRLKEHGLKKLFILAEAEPHYLAYLDAGLKKLQDKTTDLSVRATVAHESMITAAENAKEAVQSAQLYKKTEDDLSKVIDFLGSESKGLKEVLSSGGISQDYDQHCANVASMCFSLAKELKVSKPQELKDLGLASLLHDIAMKELGIPMNLKPENMDKGTLEKYKTHPTMMSDMLRDKAHVTPKTMDLILNHEELGDGKGFPEKKVLRTLPMINQVFNICNDYDRYCSFSNTSPLEASKNFFIEKMGIFELPLLNALKKIVAK